ncbi:MAG TPA: ADOP family duplicated permease [Gemmatimonadaceae bacterium]
MGLRLSVVSVVATVARDVRHAVRTIRRMAGFSFAVVLTMALGIAGTTVTLGAVNAVFLRGLPVASPEQLVLVSEHWTGGWSSTWMGVPMYSYDHFKSLQAVTGEVFSEFAASRLSVVSLRRDSESAVSRNASIVTANYFRTLGVRALKGRVFAGEDDTGFDPVAVISYATWVRDFNMDPSAIGKSIVVDSKPFVVVGIAPSEFHGTTAGIETDLWVSLDAYRSGATPSSASRRPRFEVSMVGRLRPGISTSQAEKAIAASVASLEPSTASRKLRSVSLDPFDGLPAVSRVAVVGFVSILMVTAALVTAVAAVNIAGMFLTRMAHRRREIAVRMALGAGRTSLLRQICAETVLLSCLGAGVGMAVATLIVHLLPAFHTPFAVDVSFDLSIDRTVATIVIGVACGAGLLSGVLPVVYALRENMLSGLRAAGVLTAAGGRLGKAFVVTQLALSLVLLFTAGLFQRALRRALVADPGFNSVNVVVAGISAGGHGYDAVQATAMFHDLAARLRSRPEISAVTFGNHLPLSGSYLSTSVSRPGESADPRRAINVMYGSADPSYFDAVRVPIILGRRFREADNAAAPLVMIVNQDLARRFWPGESPLGKSLTIGGGNRVVVGVTPDARYQTLSDPPRPYAYIPIDQSPDVSIIMYVRAKADAALALRALHDDLASVNPNLALERPGSLDAQLDTFRLPQRLAAGLVGVFGLVGLAIAAVGLFAVTAFDVAQRTREFGVRLALGASRGVIVRDVLGQSFRLLAIGSAVGFAAAIGIGYVARSALFGVGAFDLVVLVGVSAVLGCAALIASVVPALRASRVDPMLCLRTE